MFVFFILIKNEQKLSTLLYIIFYKVAENQIFFTSKKSAEHDFLREKVLKQDEKMFCNNELVIFIFNYATKLFIRQENNAA